MNGGPPAACSQRTRQGRSCSHRARNWRPGWRSWTAPRVAPLRAGRGAWGGVSWTCLQVQRSAQCNRGCARERARVHALRLEGVNRRGRGMGVWESLLPPPQRSPRHMSYPHTRRHSAAGRTANHATEGSDGAGGGAPASFLHPRGRHREHGDDAAQRDGEERKEHGAERHKQNEAEENAESCTAAVGSQRVGDFASAAGGRENDFDARFPGRRGVR